MFSTLIVLLSSALVFYFLVLPVLRQTPKFKELWDRTDNLFVAIREKLKGIKEKLTGALASAATIVIYLHDEIADAMREAGVDMSTFTEGWSARKVLIGSLGVYFAMRFFRWLADMRHQDELDKARGM